MNIEDDKVQEINWIPNQEMSYFLDSQYHRWHIQFREAKQGGKAKKTLLFIHGLGSSTITWRDILPLFSDYRVVALDLPGHGFTKLKTSHRSSLTKITTDIGEMLSSEKITPDGIIGHSSGAAIALKLASLFKKDTKFVASINGSFENFIGLAGIFFPLFAKLLAVTPFSGQLFSNINKRKTQVKKLLEMTGSQLDKVGTDLYSKLISDPKHVSGTIDMMAQWNHEDLLPHLDDFSVPCLFITGDNDKIVHPDVSERMSKKIKGSSRINLIGLGHLMHEENPKKIFEILENFSISGCTR